VSGTGISWTICNSAPRSRQITTPVPYRSVFTDRMPFLPPHQQRQSTEGIICHDNSATNPQQIEVCVKKHINHNTAAVLSGEYKNSGDWGRSAEIDGPPRVVCIYGGFMPHPTHHGGSPLHHGLFVSTKASTLPRRHSAQQGCILYIYMESTPYDEGWTPHPIIGCLYPVSTPAKHATTGCVSSIFGLPVTLNVTKPSRVSPTSNSTWDSISHGTRSSASLNVY